MDTNYYEKLKADFPRFGATLRLEERQQESLQSLLAYTSGALSTYRTEVEKLKANSIFSESKKSEMLAETKAKLMKTLSQEFGHVQNRLTVAEQALHSATHEVKPKDTTEQLLRFMKSKEIRETLEKLPLAKRVELVLNTVQEGDASVLRAVEGQPITNTLVLPEDVMERANKAYASRIAPEQWVGVGLAKQDLEGAEAVRNLTQVEMGHIENG